MVTVLLTILDNSITFALLFAAIWLVKAALKKHLSARLQYMIWAVVLVSLLIPIKIETGINLWSLLPKQATESITRQVEHLQPSNGTDNGSNAGVGQGTQTRDQPMTASNVPDNPTAVSGNSQPARNDAWNPMARINWLTLLWAVWLAGMAATMLWLFLGGLRLRRQILRCGNPNTPAWLQACAKECANALHMRRNVRIIVQPVLAMPAVMGIFHPILAMPESVLLEGDEQCVRHILMHEFSHVKRGDLIVIALLNALSAIYWFNPLVWLCFNLIRADMETSCDNDVVNALGSNRRQEYIRTLVHFSGVGGHSRTQAALSLQDARIKMKKRIEAMFMIKKTKPAIAVPVTLLALILLLGASVTGCLPVVDKSTAWPGPSAAATLKPASSTADAVDTTQPGATPTATSPAPAKTAETQTTSPDTSPLSAYQSVLQNKAVFFSTDANKNLSISQLNQAVGVDSGITVKATKLAIVDLENDGTPEAILWLAVNQDDSYGFEVLRYQDGKVSGYTLWYRAFMELKADGTFSFSSGAADYGFGTVKFSQSAYSVDKVSYSESSYDSNNNQSVSYTVDHKSATEADFLSAIDQQSKKPGAPWHDLTDDNIQTIFSGLK